MLYEAKLPLRQLMKLEVGDTLPLDLKPDALVTVRCGDVTLTEGRMGRVGDRVAVRVAKPLAQAEDHVRHVRDGRRNLEPNGGIVSHAFGLIIESLVAVLLLLTIGYCILLNKRLKRLKADEQALKATISELITATEIAERAIAGLKMTVRECDQNLGERLRAAERFCADMDRQLEAGEAVLDRLAQDRASATPSGDRAAAAAPRLRSARHGGRRAGLRGRARSRLGGRAA